MTLNDGLRGDNSSTPPRFDARFDLQLFPETFEPGDFENKNIVSFGRVDSVPTLELYTGIENMEKTAREAAQPGDKRLISEVFDRRVKKILEDEDVQKYLRTPSLLRNEKGETEDTQKLLKELKEIVSGWTSHVNKEGSEAEQQKYMDEGDFIDVTSPFGLDYLLSGLGTGAAQAKQPSDRQPGNGNGESSAGASASKELIKRFGGQSQQELMKNVEMTGFMKIAEQSITSLKVKVQIDALGSNIPSIRRAAEQELVKIGPDARPALEALLLHGKEPDLKHRAKSILEKIQYNADEPKRREYNELGQNVQALMSKLGIRVLGGSDVERHDPGGPVKLTNEDKVAFEKLMSKTDTVLGDKRFEEIAETSRDTSVFENLKLLHQFAETSRMTFAKTLARSDDPKDHQKAIGVMTDFLKGCKSLDLDKKFDISLLGLRLKADKNPEFMKAYQAAGGGERLLDLEIDDAPELPAGQRQQMPGPAPNGGGGGGGGEAPPGDRPAPAPSFNDSTQH